MGIIGSSSKEIDSTGLREAEVRFAHVRTVGQVCKKIGIPEQVSASGLVINPKDGWSVQLGPFLPSLSRTGGHTSPDGHRRCSAHLIEFWLGTQSCRGDRWNP